MTLLFLYYVPNNIDSIVNQVMDIEYKQKHGQYVNDKHCQPYLKPLHVNVVHVQKSRSGLNGNDVKQQTTINHK